MAYKLVNGNIVEEVVLGNKAEIVKAQKVRIDEINADIIRHNNIIDKIKAEKAEIRAFLISINELT